jgi:hypothetical protein
MQGLKCTPYRFFLNSFSVDDHNRRDAQSDPRHCFWLPSQFDNDFGAKEWWFGACTSPGTGRSQIQKAGSSEETASDSQKKESQDGVSVEEVCSTQTGLERPYNLHRNSCQEAIVTGEPHRLLCMIQTVQYWDRTATLQNVTFKPN